MINQQKLTNSQHNWSSFSSYKSNSIMNWIHSVLTIIHYVKSSPLKYRLTQPIENRSRSTGVKMRLKQRNRNNSFLFFIWLGFWLFWTCFWQMFVNLFWLSVAIWLPFILFLSQSSRVRALPNKIATIRVGQLATGLSQLLYR